MPEHLIEHRYQDMEYRAGRRRTRIRHWAGNHLRDVATFPWGKERFEAGAFGDLAGQDLIANRMHERPAILARTDAGYTVRNSGLALTSEIELPKTPLGLSTQLMS